MILKLKAWLKFRNEPVVIKPVLFSWNVGIQYKCLTGWRKGSIFCDKRDEFIFPIQTEIIMVFVKAWYWIRYYAYMQIRYWIPFRIKWYFKKPRTGEDLPF